MESKLKYLIFVLFCLPIMVTAQTDTVELYDGVTGGRTFDATLITNTSGVLAHLPNELTMSVRDCPTSTSLINQRIVLQFPNIDTLKALAGNLPLTVDSAWATMTTATYPNLRFTTPLGDVKIYAHRILESWDTTGSHPVWDSLGTFTNSGCGPPTSSSATKLDSATVDSSQNKAYTWVIPNEVMQDWIDSVDNYGIVFIAEETGIDIESSNRTFYSANVAIDSLKPKLTIIYSLPPVSILFKNQITFQGGMTIGP